MKKLLLAALALIGVAAPNQAKAYDLVTAAPVSSLTDGGTYYIYDAHADDGTTTEQAGGNGCRYAFRKASSDTPGSAVHGTHIKPTTLYATGELDNYSVWKASATESGAWKFQNVANGLYLAESGASVNEASESGAFVLEDTGTPGTFKVKEESSTNTRWDGNGGGNYPMVYWNGDGHPICFYEALSEGEGYRIAAHGYWNVTYTYPACNGKVISKTVLVADGEGAEYHVPSIDLFTSNGVNAPNGSIVSENNKNFNVQGKWFVPMVNEHVYRMTLNPQGGKSNLWFDGTNAIGSYTAVNESDVDNNLFWYFKVGELTDEGQLPVTIHGVGMADDEGLQFETADNSKGVKSTTPTVWYVEKSGAAQNGHVDFTLRDSTPNVTSYVNDRGSYLSTWNSSGAKNGTGSVLRLIELTESDWEHLSNGTATAEEIAAAKANPTPAAIRNLVKKMVMTEEEIDAVLSAGSYIIETLGIGSDEIRSSWTAYKAGVNRVNMKPAAFKTLESEVKDFITNASRNITSESYVKFRHPQRPVLMGVVGGNLRRNGEGNTTTFTLKPATNGFNIYNEYKAAYIKLPNATSSVAVFVDAADEATVFNIDLENFDAHNTYGFNFGLKDINGTGDAETYAYLHSNNANADETTVVRWSQGSSSSWYIEQSNADTAAYEYMMGGKDHFNAQTYGTGMGEYGIAPGALAAVNQANATGADASIDEKRAAGAVLRNVETALNMPQPGHLYLFSKVDGSKYMTANSSNEGKQIAMEEGTTANLLSRLFYLDNANHLVALLNGKVLGNFTSSTGINGGSWKDVLLSESDKVGTVVFGESGTTGKYTIAPQSGRYIYNANDNVDCGGTPSSAGYHWTIEEYNSIWMPIPGSTEDKITVCLPVAVYSKGSDVMTVYTAKIVDGKVYTAPFTGDVIPANTPLMINFHGIDRDPDNHLVYLQVADGTATVTEENELQGSIYAISTETPVGVRNGNGFVPVTGEINGGQAYLETPVLVTVTSDAFEAEIDALEGKVFAINHNHSSDKEAGVYRGSLIHQEGADAIWTSKKAGENAETTAAKILTEPDYQWTLVRHNGKRYLYNFGAQKFAAAYTVKTSGGGDAEFVWHFSDYPTAVDFHFLDYDVAETIADATFNILGGENVGNTRPGGMMIINNNDYPVPAVAGNSANDGCGFQVVIVADETQAEVASVEAALAAMEDEHAVAADYVANHTDASNTIPGHYNEEGYAAFAAAMETAADDAQGKYYVLTRARNAAGNNINAFEDGQVYNLFDADGNKLIAKINWGEKLAYSFEIAIATGNEVDNEDNWLCSVEGDNVQFTHRFYVPQKATPKVAEPAAARPRFAAPAGQKEVTQNFLEEGAPATYDGLGNIALGTRQVTSSASLGNADTTTTGISEVSAENGAENSVYDLQGRRVKANAKGLLIVNGKKAIVK